MNRQFQYVIKSMIAAAWRRRLLLILPILVMLPLSLAWWIYGPRTYVAKSLMLLQEAASTNPLAREGTGGPTGRIQDRIAGLQALLKSDRVLGGVFRDLASDPVRGAADFAGWRRDFSQALTVELIGTDFLEFQLKGSSPHGLGKKLEAVNSRFLEALLPEQNAMFASQVLLEKRKDELDNAQRALSTFRQRLAERLPQGLGAPHHRLAEARSVLQAKEAELARITREISDRRGRLPGASPSSARVDQEIAQVRAELASLETKNGGVPAKVAQAQSKLTELLVIRDLEVRRGTLEAEIREFTRQMDGLIKAVRQTEPIAEQLAQLEREAAEAKEAFDDYSRRYQRAATTRGAGGILNAPERIKLIDAPRDPEFPTASALRAAILALLSSIGLGIGLTLLAELTDPRLRSPEEVADATGLPVLARLS